MASNEKLLSDIHAAIAAYCENNHDFSFKANAPVVRLHEPTFSTDEINAAVDVLLSTRVTMGPKVKAFERMYADMFGHRHGVMNNSGSSANLLAIATLVNARTPDHLSPGDEVIVPALSWSTTVWPLVQCGLKPVIVDIDPLTLNMDPNEVELAISPKTRAVMLVHVYGNPCDMDALIDICKRNNLQLIEDCCEALGATYKGKSVGGLGRVGTFSFYFSHHMTTLEGGICVSDDMEFSEVMRALRAHGWTRELESRDKYLKAHPDIDPRFLFINVGYNLRATELQGAFGIVQLPKLSGFVARRRENTAAWTKDFAKWDQFFLLQKETSGAESSCFGFPMTVKDEAPFSSRELAIALNESAIETRPIIAGNIAAQPAMKLFDHRVVGDLVNSNRVMRGGITFGNHQAVDANARAYVTDHVRSFLASRGFI